MDISQAALSGDGMFNGQAHGLSISEDGNRGYFVSVGMPKLADLTNPDAKMSDGFYVVDTSEVQARKADAQMKVISSLAFKNGAARSIRCRSRSAASRTSSSPNEWAAAAWRRCPRLHCRTRAMPA